MKPDQFVDFVRIFVKAGDGGDGIVAFLREKFMPEGGPAGGHGGSGGSVYLEGDPQLLTLLDLKMRPSLKAERGANGENKNKTGRGGADLIVKVPLGTTVVDAATKEELGDLTQPGQRLCVARGGRGGRGNESFATPSHRTPFEREEGEPGEERGIILELKVLADVGLVGLPNAGKSTMLRALTNANPKIAPYPFTTLHPNLGILANESLSRVLTVADIPGLIEGAHRGAGLGDRFLRHIERTRLLLHLVAPPDRIAADPKTAAERDEVAQEIAYAYLLVREELRSYSAELEAKPTIVCLNKSDLLSETTIRRIRKEFKALKVKFLEVSALTAEGTDALKAAVFEALEARPEGAGAKRKKAAAEKKKATAPATKAAKSKPLAALEPVPTGGADDSADSATAKPKPRSKAAAAGAGAAPAGHRSAKRAARLGIPASKRAAAERKAQDDAIARRKSRNVILALRAKNQPEKSDDSDE